MMSTVGRNHSTVSSDDSGNGPSVRLGRESFRPIIELDVVRAAQEDTFEQRVRRAAYVECQVLAWADMWRAEDRIFWQEKPDDPPLPCATAVQRMK